MKRTFPAALLVILLLVLLVPSAVQAGSGLTVTASSVEVNFPADITFSISAESDLSITDIRLHYTVECLIYTQVVAEIFITFIPAKSVDTRWVWDMRQTGGLPPGANVTYWWTVTDSSGEKIVTLPSLISFEDKRYDWKNLQQGQVTLYWYDGNGSFGEELMLATQEALIRLESNTGAELENPVSLYIYGSQSDLLGAMIFPQEWTGGIAYSEYGTIAIGIEPTPSQIDWGKRTISHELTHLVINQLTYNPYNYIPNWLNEGLAMVSEGELELTFVLVLSLAEAENSYISVRSLCSPFPADINQTLLAYAESYQFVAYLINEYGRDKMLELLSVFKQGSGYDEALLKVYGFDMDGLNSLWRS